MALAMSRPWKHPKTGIYWLRRRVPADLIATVGQREVRQSLGTLDPAEAKQKLVQRLAELDAQWTSLRKGKRAITDREAHTLALPFYETWLRDFRENPSEQLYWDTRLHEGMWTRRVLPEVPASEGEPGIISADSIVVKSMRLRCVRAADEVLAEYGFDQDEWSRLKLAKAIGEAIQRASVILAQEERGIYSPGTEPRGDATPLVAEARSGARLADQQTPGSIQSTNRASPAAASLTGLVEAWWTEAKVVSRDVVEIRRPEGV